MAKKKYRVKVEDAFCKKCGICVHFCRPHVLELKNQKLIVEDEAKCVGCKECEIRCPDFAINVEVRDQ